MSNGAVNWESERLALAKKGIILRGGGADEAPPVYRPLNSVLEAHRGTVEIVATLHPVIVVMAGPDTEDPWKD